MKTNFFKPKFRIVEDRFAGFEVQIKRWWFPVWIQCWHYGPFNSFWTMERAENWIKAGRPKYKKP
jgi:hypothetical protein